MSAMEPGPAVLCKLGSLAIHVEELFEGGGHDFDKAAVKGLLADPEVTEWLQDMNDLGMLPVKR